MNHEGCADVVCRGYTITSERRWVCWTERSVTVMRVSRFRVDPRATLHSTRVSLGMTLPARWGEVGCGYQGPNKVWFMWRVRPWHELWQRRLTVNAAVVNDLPRGHAAPPATIDETRCIDLTDGSSQPGRPRPRGSVAGRTLCHC